MKNSKREKNSIAFLTAFLIPFLLIHFSSAYHSNLFFFFFFSILFTLFFHSSFSLFFFRFLFHRSTRTMKEVYTHETLVPFEVISSGSNALLVPFQQLLEGPMEVLLCERVNNLRHSLLHLLNCLITTASELRE